MLHQFRTVLAHQSAVISVRGWIVRRPFYQKLVTDFRDEIFRQYSLARSPLHGLVSCSVRLNAGVGRCDAAM